MNGKREGLPSLKLTFSRLKMDDWNCSFFGGRPIFRCELLVSGMVNVLVLLVGGTALNKRMV